MQHVACDSGSSKRLAVITSNSSSNDTTGNGVDALRFSYDCSSPQFSNAAYFTILVVIVTFTLLIKDYTPELVVMTAAIILCVVFITPVHVSLCTRQ